MTTQITAESLREIQRQTGPYHANVHRHTLSGLLPDLIKMAEELAALRNHVSVEAKMEFHPMCTHYECARRREAKRLIDALPEEGTNDQ
jgi:hypothetical protein